MSPPPVTKRKPRARITTRPLTSADWAIVERLFGENGACGGCWCMLWRLPKGGKAWEQAKGEPNRRAFKRLIANDRVHGALALCDGEAVGWCSLGPREDFPGLARSRVLKTDWTCRTWSITCFYIPAKWRQRDVATALLKQAIQIARDNGARELEGYPVRPSPKGNGSIPAAFAWTGVPRLFEKLRFTNISPSGHSRDIFRKRFRRA